jgi:hypothetical protein
MIVLIFEEKHGNRVFVCTEAGDRNRVCLKVLGERIADGGWYDEDDVSGATAALLSGRSAYKFLSNRRDYEYENLREEIPEDY